MKFASPQWTSTRTPKTVHRFTGWHGGGLVATMACIVIAAAVSTTPAARAGTVVRFDMNYSTAGDDGPINFFNVELYDDQAPITVENFLKYVNNGLYDNSIIHRSIQDFVIQGGGFTPLIENKVVTALNPITTYGAIQNEFSADRSNTPGTIAMAKLGGDPNSATSQWFINTADNSDNLDNQNGGFTVFGRVLNDGMALVHAINGLTTSDLSGRFGDAFTDVPTLDAGSFATVSKVACVGSVSGVAYIDSNRNGVIDSSDYVIPGALISLTRSGDGAPLATVRSGQDGSYSFSQLAAGTYVLQIESASTPTGRDNGAGRMIFNLDGTTIVGVGTSDVPAQNTYVQDHGQSGKNYNLAETVYPASLISVRMLLNNSEPPAHATPVAVPKANTTDSTLDFGYVLVKNSKDATLSVGNVGGEGSALSGAFPAAGGDFSTAAARAFGPLAPGQTAEQIYTYAPPTRGANSKDIAVATTAGDLKVTLSGIGVAPVQQVDASTADAGLVRIGATATVGVTIKNVGDGNLSGLGDASNLQGAVAALSGTFSGDGGGFSLADAASRSFSFTYAPTTRGADSATLAIDFSNGSDDQTNGPQSVAIDLLGQGVGPEFSSDLAPGAALDFGMIGFNETKSLFLNLSNVSADPNGGDSTLTDLTLLGAEISGGGADWVSIVGFADGDVIHAGNSLTLEIAYNGAGAPGEYAALLTLRTDEGAAFGAAGNAFTYPIAINLLEIHVVDQTNQVPEPGAMLLLATAGLGLVCRFRRGRSFSIR